MMVGTGTASGNVASSNVDGIDATSGTYTITKNAVAGSSGNGIFLTSATMTVTKNSITGSAGAGIIFNSGTLTSLTANSIFGNGLAAGANHNCGIRNASGGSITATGNYWGASTGPGADPADATCGSPVTAIPAAGSEIKVLVPPIR
jgi:nitrous oxidase accessory protein NosD